MMSSNDSKLVEMCKALSEPVRVHILRRLPVEGGPPLSVALLGTAIGVAPAVLSKHLIILERAGLVLQQRSGRYNPRFLRSTGFDDVCRLIQGLNPDRRSSHDQETTQETTQELDIPGS